MFGAYLANKPTGAPEVYLIVAVVMFSLALILAGVGLSGKNGAIAALERMTTCAGLGALALALLTH